MLHGFGFAGALAETGLPPHQAPVALLCFNVGVELGQLGTIAAAAVVTVSLRRLIEASRWPRVVAIYAMGAAAAYWSIDRALALL